jgi:Domain of unknown function (DUF4440)
MARELHTTSCTFSGRPPRQVTKMIVTRDALVLITLFAAAGPVGAQGVPAVDVELKRATQELLDAIAPGNREVWDRYVDERAIHVDENGIVRTKAELLKELTPLPPGLKGSIEIASFRVLVQGDTAVATHEDHEHLDYHGQQVETRFRATDTWVKTGSGWRLAATQVMALLDDPSAAPFADGQGCEYAGVFALTADISTIIRCSAQGLVTERTGRPPVEYRREAGDVFFAPGQPRTRRIFERDASGRVIAFADRREGHDIVWKRTSSGK